MTGDHLVGQTIADGKYEIVRLLGEGGMGAVYQARQVAMDRMVALKLIVADMVKSPAAAARFHREMKLTARIEHPNTIRVYDFGETDGQLYLTMELLRGQTLKQVIAQSPLGLDRIVRIATQVTRALQAAHAEGVVHRDLKPDNIMLVEHYGERDVVKVLDFGIAKSLDEPALGVTTAGAVIGTPVYMSVEQAMGRPVDQRSDLYSLGIILYEMASGRVPFVAPTLPALLVAHAMDIAPPLTEVVRGVSPGLSALVDELLCKDPAGRPQTALVVEQRLAVIAAQGTPPGADPRFGATEPLHAAGPAGYAPQFMDTGLSPPSDQAHAPATSPQRPARRSDPPGPQPVATSPQRPGRMSQPPDQFAATAHNPPVTATVPVGLAGHPGAQPSSTAPGQPSLPSPPPPYVAPHMMATPPRPQGSSRGVWLALAAVVVVGGGVTIAALAGGSGGGELRPQREPVGSGSPGSAAVAPAPVDAADIATKDRLAEASAKLAGFGDPAPPDACPPDAAADAAELVLAARQSITSDAIKAIDAADRALARCPSAAAAHNIRGNALQVLGKFDEAGDAYARALQFAPSYDAPRFNLGIIQLRRRDPAAIATFTEVLRRKPDDADAYKSRGQAYVNAGRFDEAAADLEDSLRRKPDDGRAWLLLGEVRERGRKADAKAAYCKAAALGITDAKLRCKKKP